MSSRIILIFTIAMICAAEAAEIMSKLELEVEADDADLDDDPESNEITESALPSTGECVLPIVTVADKYSAGASKIEMSNENVMY